MIDKWTGTLVGKMHNNQVTYEELASRLGITKAYVSMVLNGKRNPPNSKARFNNALSQIIEERANTTGI